MGHSTVSTSTIPKREVTDKESKECLKTFIQTDGRWWRISLAGSRPIRSR